MTRPPSPRSREVPDADRTETERRRLGARAPWVRRARSEPRKGVTMRAVVWKGPHQMAVEQVEDVQMTEPTDAILRLTTTAICGSDLHMYEGRAPGEPGTV